MAGEKRKREATFADVPKALFPTIFSFLNTRSLIQASQVSKMWHEHSEEVLKVHRFSAMLRKAGIRQIDYQTVLDYISTHKLAVNFSVPDYTFQISQNEAIVYICPSLLHDLAQWVPLGTKEKEVYQSIFNKLLQLKANPNAITRAEAIDMVRVDTIRKTSKEETFLETAITMANPYLVYLLLELYNKKELVVENPTKILDDAIIVHRVWCDRTFLDFDPESRNVDLRNRSRNILLMLIKEGSFKPDFTMLRYYEIENPGFQLEIPAGESQLPNFKSLSRVLFELYPGEKIEWENRQLKFFIQEQQQEIESLKAKSDAAQATLQKEVEELREALKNKEQTESPRPNL